MDPQSSEDKLFIARLSDMAVQVRRSGTYAFSAFLDERQCVIANNWCSRNTGDLMFSFHGGFPDARRKILAIYPDYCEDYVNEDVPIKCITFSYREEDKLTHRDFLGSFMALRLKRETIGDIVVSSGRAQALVSEIAAKTIMTSISRIGKVGVKAADDLPFDMEVTQEYKDMPASVASLRLDCIVAAAANLSREKASLLIKSDKVDINHFTVSSVSKEVQQGDIISVRGVGRFILSDIGGLTRKDRLHIILRKYI